MATLRRVLMDEKYRKDWDMKLPEISVEGAEAWGYISGLLADAFRDGNDEMFKETIHGHIETLNGMFGITESMR